MHLKSFVLTTHFTDMCIPHFFLASERRSTVDVRRRPGYKIWRLFKFSSIRLSFKTRHWLFILIYIKFGIFKLEKAPNFVTRPASNVDRRTPFGSEKKMRNAHISEMRSKTMSISWEIPRLRFFYTPCISAFADTKIWRCINSVLPLPKKEFLLKFLITTKNFLIFDIPCT
jgi:hypothetical protein